MAKTSPQRIILLADAPDAFRGEALAGEAGIGPGDLLEFSSGTGTVLRHNGANGACTPKLVAMESQTPNSDTLASIDQDYASGDTLYYAIPRPGEIYNLWLAAGENAAALALLESDGDGALAVKALAPTGANTLVGVAEKAVDNSGGGSPVRIEVRIV